MKKPLDVPTLTDNLRACCKLVLDMAFSALPEGTKLPRGLRTKFYGDLETTPLMETLALAILVGPTDPKVQEALSSLKKVIEKTMAEPGFLPIMMGGFGASFTIPIMAQAPVMGQAIPVDAAPTGGIPFQNYADLGESGVCPGCPNCGESKNAEPWWSTTEIVEAMKIIDPDKANLLISTLTAMDDQAEEPPSA